MGATVENRQIKSARETYRKAILLLLCPAPVWSQVDNVSMNDSDFLKAIEADPRDPTPRLVYADWLDEQGDLRGALLRIQEELRHIEVPHRRRKEMRMQELLRDGIEPLTITRKEFGMELVLIFPGEFLMGSPSAEKGRGEEEDQLAVTLTQPFYLSRYVVTQAEWFQVMGTRPWGRAEWVVFGHRYPATYVSWHSASGFCEILTEQGVGLPSGWSFSLPTEAQWEYACRSGTTTRFSFGDDEDQLHRYGWYTNNADATGEQYAHEVGQKLPNGWGLYDLHGNVWEWCVDYWQDQRQGGTDPRVDEVSPSRIRRGGSWCFAAEYCRSASRFFHNPIESRSSLGFRVALIPSA